MEIIGKDEIKSFNDRGVLKAMTCFEVRKSRGFKVDNFMDLATRIAALQFKNPAHVLLFRGQKSDHKRTNKKATSFTTLSPSLFRGQSSRSPDAGELMRRFQILEHFESDLVRQYQKKGFPDLDRLERQRILRWSILQHYEVCPTPLLDVSHSLRIAVSFACDHADDEAFLFVLGVPNISGAITASAETGLQIIRLSSVCPPEAVRPHIQEGYLLGEYPEMIAYNQKALYGHYEIDFGRRLIAKFRFNPNDFRNDPDFPIVSREALYPDKNDPLFKLAKRLKG
jgi:hypothetical protein